MSIDYKGDHSFAVLIKNGKELKVLKSWDDMFLVPTTRLSVTPAQPNYSYVSIPGTSISADLTTVISSKVSYGRRNGSWEFYVDHDKYESWAYSYRYLQDSINGKRVVCYLRDFPDELFSGRLTLSDWRDEEQYSTVSISYDFDPVYDGTIAINDVKAAVIWNSPRYSLETVISQEKTVNPTIDGFEVVPDNGHNYLSKVTLTHVPYSESINSGGGVTAWIMTSGHDSGSGIPEHMNLDAFYLFNENLQWNIGDITADGYPSTGDNSIVRFTRSNHNDYALDLLNSGSYNIGIELFSSVTNELPTSEECGASNYGLWIERSSSYIQRISFNILVYSKKYNPRKNLIKYENITVPISDHIDFRVSSYKGIIKYTDVIYNDVRKRLVSNNISTVLWYRLAVVDVGNGRGSIGDTNDVMYFGTIFNASHYSGDNSSLYSLNPNDVIERLNNGTHYLRLIVEEISGGPYKVAITTNVNYEGFSDLEWTSSSLDVYEFDTPYPFLTNSNAISVISDTQFSSGDKFVVSLYLVRK